MNTKSEREADPQSYSARAHLRLGIYTSESGLDAALASPPLSDLPADAKKLLRSMNRRLVERLRDPAALRDFIANPTLFVEASFPETAQLLRQHRLMPAAARFASPHVDLTVSLGEPRETSAVDDAAVKLRTLFAGDVPWGNAPTADGDVDGSSGGGRK